MGVPKGEVARSAAEAEAVAKKIGLCSVTAEERNEMLLKWQAVMIWSSRRKCSLVVEEREPSITGGREVFASSTREGPLPPWIYIPGCC